MRQSLCDAAMKGEEMKRFIAVLLLVLALLGVSRTPEAQVEGVMLGIVAPVVAGCATLAIGMHTPHTTPPPTEPPATLP